MVAPKNTSSIAPASPEAVLRFLEDNPDFLIRYHLDAKMEPGKVINLGQAVIQGAGDVLRRFHASRGRMEDIHAANTEAMLRVHQCACLLIAATSAEEITTLIAEHFPELLGIAAARLVVASASPLANLDGVIVVKPTALPHLTRGEAVSLGAPDAAQAEVFAPLLASPPSSVAFAALPAILPDPSPGAGAAGVLALASTDAAGFDETDATDLISFTATMIAIGLIARAEP